MELRIGSLKGISDRVDRNYRTIKKNVVKVVKEQKTGKEKLVGYVLLEDILNFNKENAKTD